MNVFTVSPRHQPWLWQVTGLCFILGLLLAGSLQTVTNIRRSGGIVRLVNSPVAGNPSLVEALRKRDKEITDLREKQTRLENAMSKGSDRLKELNDELQRVKVLGGLAEVSGPGVSLMLRDARPPSGRAFDAARYIIHDYDLQMVVNELSASGAEAIAVNGQRITGRSAIRCVGPTILVNFVPLAPPYEVQAIGDPNKLSTGLNLAGGYLDELRSADASMFRLEKRQKLVTPAYTGSTELAYAHPTEGDGADRTRRR